MTSVKLGLSTGSSCKAKSTVIAKYHFCLGGKLHLAMSAISLTVQETIIVPKLDSHPLHTSAEGQSNRKWLCNAINGHTIVCC